jgi:phage tail sheath protein FI
VREMPSTLTYPGVYIEEIPSGVRTITGVATSVTAFIGRARCGPVNEPVTINNFGDFERTFGGLWLKSTMSYAVRDFYLNGGSQAIIVRLFHPFFATAAERAEALDAAQDVATAAADAAGVFGATAEEVADAARAEADSEANAEEPRKTAADTVAKAAEAEALKADATAEQVKMAAEAAISQAAPLTKAKLVVNGLNLEAAYQGSWGNEITAEVNHDTKDPDDKTLFNLIVSDGVISEVFLNVSVSPDNARYVLRVLEQGSKLVRVEEDSEMPSERPSETVAPVQAAGGSDGKGLESGEFLGSEAGKTGIYALEKADIFNLLCIPPYNEDGNVDYDLIIGPAAAYCEKRRAMLLIDPKSEWSSKDDAKTGIGTGVGTTSKNSALFFPRLRQPNSLRDNQMEEFAPCGAVAGVFARTDTQRGVWKAPAGLDATLVGVPQLSVPLTDPENGELNPLGINCLRAMPAAGRVIWGSRTLQGNDRLASEWKYIPVRRVALYIEESLYRGTQWVVFEPNDEPLWAQIRLNVGAFMHSLFRQGAFQGTTPKEAYFVKCDKETTTQNDIDRGIVNILVGFAPLKPAEFVVIKIQQMAGQIQT